MTETFLKFPLFYLASKKIQQEMEQENSKLDYYFKFSHSGFPHSPNKRVRISKTFLPFFTLFLYIPWCIIVCYPNFKTFLQPTSVFFSQEVLERIDMRSPLRILRGPSLPSQQTMNIFWGGIASRTNTLEQQVVKY